MNNLSHNEKKTNYTNALNLDKNSLSKLNDLTQIKHYPPTNKEWFNTIYQYNKNYIKSLPITDKIINKLFKSYFHLTSSFEKYKIKPRNMRIKAKRLSANRIFLSRAEMKHTNNKVIITLYTYNRTLFCNGLTILRNRILINKNISVLKKSFFSGIVNISRKFIFSKTIINILDPFNSLVSIDENSKNSIKSLMKSIRRAKARSQDKNIIRKLHKALVKTIKIAKSIAKAKVYEAKTKKKIKKLYIFQLLKNIATNQRISKIIKLMLPVLNLKTLNSFKINSLINDNKEITLQSKGFYISKSSYSNIIKTYLNFYKFKLDKIKNILFNYKYRFTGQKFLYKNKFRIINTNYFNNIHIKNFNFNINSFIRSKFYYLKPFKFLNFINVSNKHKMLDSFKNEKGIKNYQIKTDNVKNMLDFNYNNEFNKIHENSKINFFFKNIILDSLYKKLRRFKNIYVNTALINYKVIKSNLNKYNFLFYLINSKNTIFSFYGLKLLYKLRRFVLLKKIILSPWKMINLKINSKIFVRKLKLINNSTLADNEKTTVKENDNFIVKQSSSRSFINSLIFSRSFTPKIIGSENILNEEKNILISQSNVLLKKKLDLFLPLYIYYVQMISIHNYKYKNWFLLGLKNIMYNVYKKKIEFNIVNLKYMHLSSDILSESMAIKLRNRKNRILRVLKRVLKLIKIPTIHQLLTLNNEKQLNLDKYKTLKIHFSSSNKQIKSILNSISLKKISGIRIEASGRLTKRLTASRSLFKIKYKGSLKNINSSYKGLSSNLVKGYMKSNIQYTNVNSKTRNGSFGLKTWISSF